MSYSHEEGLAENISAALHYYNEAQEFNSDPHVVRGVMLDILNDFCYPDAYVRTVQFVVNEDGHPETFLHESAPHGEV